MVKPKVKITSDTSKYWEEKGFLKKIFYLFMIYITLSLALAKGEVTLNDVDITLLFDIVMGLFALYFIRKLWISRYHIIEVRSDGTIRVTHKSVLKTEKVELSKQVYPFLRFYAVEEYVFLEYFDPGKNKVAGIKRYVSWRLETTQKTSLAGFKEPPTPQAPPLLEEPFSEPVVGSVSISSQESIEILSHKHVSKKDLEKINLALSQVFSLTPEYAGRIYVPFKYPVVKERSSSVVVKQSASLLISLMTMLFLSYIAVILYEDGKIPAKYKFVIYFVLFGAVVMMFLVMFFLSNFLLIITWKYKALPHPNVVLQSVQTFFYQDPVTGEISTGLLEKNESVPENHVYNGADYDALKSGLYLVTFTVFNIFSFFFLLVLSAIVGFLRAQSDSYFLEVVDFVVEFVSKLVVDVMFILIVLFIPLIIRSLYLIKQHNLMLLLFHELETRG